MATEYMFIGLIVLLLGYIIYLHISLAKKNIFIESTVKRLSGIEKDWNQDELNRFMTELRKVHGYSSFFNDRLFDEKPMKFLLENKLNARIFIHYTKEEEVAKKILDEGFYYADSFYKTALPVTNDRLDLLIKHNNRKSFGKYLMIMIISNEVFDYYGAELDQYGLNGIAVENILTETETSINENGDTVFLLPKCYVKGYINHITGEVTSNNAFNPSYNSPAYKRNIDKLRKQKSTG